MSRDTIFISHATPEDNEFAIWLASRLEMLGYKTWLDKNCLLGGEPIWQNIQDQIKNHAQKFLLVYSSHINDATGNLKDGIQKELSYAESIAKNESLKDFIIPLNIDPEAAFNEFIGANRLTQIIFYDWAEGLNKLIKKLNQDNIPINLKTINSSIINWYENHYISKCSIIRKEQKYFSSFWEIKNIPEFYYIYQFDTEKSAIAVYNNNLSSIVTKIGSSLITFDEQLNTKIDSNILFTPRCKNVFKINSQERHLNNKQAYPTNTDCDNALKSLLFKCLKSFFQTNNLINYQLANKRNAYYFQKSTPNITKIKFKYPFSPDKKKEIKTKGLVGIFDHDKYWHYGISYQTILSPIIGFSLKSHLIFTSDGQSKFFDQKKQHSYRRKKGKHFFNEEWRDMLLAFIQALKDKNEIIKVPISPFLFFEMAQYPAIFSCDYDYIDPAKEMTIDSIESYYYEDEEINE